MSMTPPELLSDARHWLRRLSWALASLPGPERHDLLKEIAAHLAERVQSGQATNDVLARFGPPEDYARRFLDDYGLSDALGSERSSAMIVALGRRAHRSFVALAAVALVSVLAAAAFVVVLTAIIKVFDPAHAGLWRGSSALFIGVIDDPSKAHELLGAWIFPLAALAVLLTWLIGRVILLAALRVLPRVRASSSGSIADALR
jgi:uncharacterized membrane protein